MRDMLKRKSYISPPHPHFQVLCPIPNNPHPICKIQQSVEQECTNTADPAHILQCQQVISTFLFYAQAINLTILPVLNSLSKQQMNPIDKTIDILNQFLDYATTNPDAAIQYHASDMHLWIDSNTAYVVVPKD